MHPRVRAALYSLIFLGLCLSPASSVFATEAYARGIIIKYKPLADTAEKSFMPRAAVQAHDQQVLTAALRQKTGLDFAFDLAIPTGANSYVLDGWYTETELDVIAAELSKDPLIEYAETNRLMQAAGGLPDDEFFPQQWHLWEDNGASLNLLSAWQSYTGEGVVVAVLDTGYTDHPDLDGNILPGYDMVGWDVSAGDGDGRDPDARDPGDWRNNDECSPGSSAKDSSWHGTHVGGTIAAVANNVIGVVGVAYNAGHLPVRVLGKCGGSTMDIAAAMIWAAGLAVPGLPVNPHPAKVLNLSLSGLTTCPQTYQDAINAVRAASITVIVAAGNDNHDASLNTPANCAGVITVAATTRQGAKASYSNFGSVVDLAGPGGDGPPNEHVLSTLNEGITVPTTPDYVWLVGTSMATPHVAGVAALIYEGAPNILPDQIEAILKDTAQPFPGACSQCGTGIVDAAAAVLVLPPLNDNYTHPGLVWSGYFSPGTLLHAFDDGDTNGAGSYQPDVWYFYTAPGPGTLKVNTCFSNALSGIDTVLSVHAYTGATGSAANQLALNDDFTGSGGDPGAACNAGADSAVSVEVEQGDALLIRVSRYDASTDGAFFLGVSFLPRPPANNDFNNAIILQPGSTAGTLLYATNDGSTSSAGSNQPDVWYAWTAPESGIVRVSTCFSRAASGLDTVLSLHANIGVTGSAGNQLALNDDYQEPGGDASAPCPDREDSAVILPVDAGASLLIRVSRYDDSSNGIFFLHLSFVPDFIPAASCAPGGNRGVVDVPLNIDTSVRFDGAAAYGATGLPASLIIGAGNGIISGTPLAGEVAASPYAVHVTGDAQSFDFMLTIDASNEVIFYADMEPACVLPAP